MREARRWARFGSLGEVLPDAAPPAALFVCPPGGPRPDLLTTEMPHRAIVVAHLPERERRADHVPAVLGERYDAFLWVAGTRPPRPLHTLRVNLHEPETYPGGV